MRTYSSVIVGVAIVASLADCKSTSPVEPAPPPPVQRTPIPASMPAPVVLKFSSNSMDAIEAGTKTSSTRKGVRQFPGGIATAVGGNRTLHLKIISAVQKKLGDLTDADAKTDGSESLDAFKNALNKNYPGITADDVVTVITFGAAK